MNDLLSQSLGTPAESPKADNSPLAPERDTAFYLQHFAPLDSDQLEAEVRKYRGRNPESMSKDDLHRVLALMRLHRRTTAGPPKGKASKEPFDAAGAM